MAAPKTDTTTDLKTPVVASATVPLTSKRIQDIQPGQWVRADNPSDEEDDTEYGKNVDPATWKLLKLKAPKLDGTLADVSLLRPQQWLAQQAAAVGGTVYISVPECGIDGNAKVLAIEGCPPITANPGPGFQIVTGTFQHEAAKTLDIAVEGESKPIGTTPNHPIWSVDREAFVRADSLTVGERLQSLNGITTVTNITARGPPEPVYNLEVQVKHTYYVADSGVLVHNGAPCKADAEKLISKHAIDMNSITAKSDLNALGFKRNGPSFWRKLKKKNPDLFSAKNKELISEGRSPYVDSHWIRFNPQHAGYRGDKLIHHHIDQGRFASGLPESAHQLLYSLLHTRTLK